MLSYYCFIFIFIFFMKGMNFLEMLIFCGYQGFWVPIELDIRGETGKKAELNHKLDFLKVETWNHPFVILASDKIHYHMFLLEQCKDHSKQIQLQIWKDHTYVEPWQRDLIKLELEIASVTSDKIRECFLSQWCDIIRFETIAKAHAQFCELTRQIENTLVGRIF